jgi:hypothetical protein
LWLLFATILEMSSSPIEQHPSLAFSVPGDVGLILWTGEPTIEANRWLIARFSAAISGIDGTAVGIQIIGDGAPVPDSATRRYVQQSYQQDLSRVRRLVNTPLGDSLRQNIIRTVLRTMAVVGDRKKVLTIAGTIEEALDLVAAVSSPLTPSRAVLSDGIDRLFNAKGLSRLAFTSGKSRTA